MTLHLSVLNPICHSFSQTWRLSGSCCRAWASAWHLIFLSAKQSSAKMPVLDLALEGRSFMKAKEEQRTKHTTLWHSRGALHSGGASERFAELCYATVCFKKAPAALLGIPWSCLSASAFFATYRCIEI